MFCYQFQLIEIHAANERLLSWLPFPLTPLHEFKQSRGCVMIWFIKMTCQTKISPFPWWATPSGRAQGSSPACRPTAVGTVPGEAVGAHSQMLAGTQVRAALSPQQTAITQCRVSPPCRSTLSVTGIVESGHYPFL